MSDLSFLLAPSSIDSGLSAASKKALFHQLSMAAARSLPIPAKTVLSAIGEREKLGSTGFGAGIAIPHGKLEGIDRLFGYFARLKEPVDFRAVDGLPVDLVFLLLSPTDAGADHLKALASISRTLRDRQILAKLRGARSNDAIYALLAGGEALHAA